MTEDEKKQRLAALKAEIEQIDAQREERARANRDEVAELEREVAERRALAKAEEEHGADAVVAIRTAGGLVIVKRPNHMQYRKFMSSSEALVAKGTPDAMAKLRDESAALAISHLVYPSKEAFSALAEKYPGVPQIVANVVVDLAAGRAVAVSEKP